MPMTYRAARRGRAVAALLALGLASPMAEAGNALPPAVTAADQTVRFGTLTLAGMGGVAPAVAGGPLVTLAKIGGRDAADFAITDDLRLVPAADGALDDGDRVRLLANGTAAFTVTVEGIAGRYTVADDAEMAETWDVAAAGSTIQLRGAEPVDAVPDISIAMPEGREGGIAPFGARFEVAGLEGPVDHILRHAEFRWDYGESYALRTAPGDPRPQHVLDSRYSRGAWGGHVYLTPGEHTVTLTMTIAPGREATATRRVRVLDGDRVFAGRKTAVYSKEGDFRGAPPGAARFVRLDRALAYVNARPTAGGVRARLLLRAGETTTIDSGLPVRSIYLGRFGEGPNPVIRPNVPNFEDGKLSAGALLWARDRPVLDGLTVYGIDFVGTYDPVSPAPSPDQGVNLYGIQRLGEVRAPTFFGNTFTGLSSGVGVGGEHGVFVNNLITNWADYGASIGTTRSTLLGNIIVQHPQAISGTMAKRRNVPGEPNAALHGPIRIPRPERLVLSQNHFYSHNGWTGRPEQPLHQPAIRLGGQTDMPGTAIVSENVFGGGLTIIGMNPPVQWAVTPATIVFANNIFQADDHTNFLLSLSRGGTVFRNNIFRARRDQDSGAFGPQLSAIHMKMANSMPENATTPLMFYNNTFLIENPVGSTFNLYSGDHEQARIEVENTLVVDDRPDAVDESAMFDARLAPTHPSVIRPVEAGRVALIDFYGRPRGSKAHQGAVEPD
ncbi:MAG: hypothetical protein AAF677_08175 [Pseudomonadota bacterium]